MFSKQSAFSHFYVFVGAVPFHATRIPDLFHYMDYSQPVGQHSLFIQAQSPLEGSPRTSTCTDLMVYGPTVSLRFFFVLYIKNLASAWKLEILFLHECIELSFES